MKHFHSRCKNWGNNIVKDCKHSREAKIMCFLMLANRMRIVSLTLFSAFFRLQGKTDVFCIR